MNTMKSAYNDTIFLRFLAIILVVNSHMDVYYPIKHIGTGGMIGNTLFFLLSSFGLFLSQQKHALCFTDWCANRIKRIYPSIWVSLILLTIPIGLIFGDMQFKPLVIAGYFFYPTQWFLQALIVFYFISWFLLYKYSDKSLLIAMSAIAVAYTCFYLLKLDLTKFSIEDIPFNLKYYFLVFLIGMYLASHSKRIRYSGIGDLLIVLLSLFVIYGHKYLMTKQLLLSIQFVEHLACIVLAIYLLKISRSPFVLKSLMASPLANIVKFTSNMTLEIYIVHAPISLLICKLNLPFPLNGLVYISSVVLISMIVKKTSNLILASQYFRRVGSTEVSPQIP